MAASSTSGYWLDDSDVVSTDDRSLSEIKFATFPQEWPAVYHSSPGLKALIGKKGRCAGKKVAVLDRPSPGDLAHIHGLDLLPLQSLTNAALVAEAKGLPAIHGWAVFEHRDRAPGEAFLAVRFAWNVFPDGRWVDFTPRPAGVEQVLAAEAVEPSAARQKGKPTDQMLGVAAALARVLSEAASTGKADGSESTVVQQLRLELAAATKEADTACCKLRKLEARCRLLEQQLTADAQDVGGYSRPHDGAKLGVGAAARIERLSDAQDLNGQEVVIEQWDSSKELWLVRLPTGDLRAVPGHALELLCAAQATPLLSTFGCETAGHLSGGMPMWLWPLVYSGFIRVRLADELLAKLNVQIDQLWKD